MIHIQCSALICLSSNSLYRKGNIFCGKEETLTSTSFCISLQKNIHYQAFGMELFTNEVIDIQLYLNFDIYYTDHQA